MTKPITYYVESPEIRLLEEAYGYNLQRLSGIEKRILLGGISLAITLSIRPDGILKLLKESLCSDEQIEPLVTAFYILENTPIAVLVGLSAWLASHS
ncbi:MAG: hypothetical protein HC769_21685 [Cyanobacteria bacterium CRU_2_1]|nr:hypothetical protein [Cyanobacteria bacterium CRU_2_1]